LTDKQKGRGGIAKRKTKSGYRVEMRRRVRMK
jgi:hypothetical protein